MFSFVLAIIMVPTFAFAQEPLPSYSLPVPIYTGPSVSSQNISATVSKCNIDISSIGDLLCKIGEILNATIPVLVALGVVYFVWGVVTYMIGSEEEAKKKGKNRIIYGIIGLAVIVGLWGLVNIVVNTFGLGGASAPSLSPLAVGGDSTCSPAGDPKFQDIACYVTRIINDSVIPLIFALAVAMFVWGVVQFILNSDEEAKKAKGKQFMIWGLVALTVMISVWGLVSILGGTFDFNTSVLPQVCPPGQQCPP